MLLCARQMKAQGRLGGNVVVATVMSNIGLELALRESAIDLVRTPVGDKYVMEEMQARGASRPGADRAQPGERLAPSARAIDRRSSIAQAASLAST